MLLEPQKGVKDFHDHFQHIDHCVEGVVPIKLSVGIGIEFDLPEMVQLHCEALYIDKPIYIRTITKPWVSEKYLFANVKNTILPKSFAWIKLLELKGFKTSWRYGGSEIKLPEQVPYPDYSGWFLQETNKVKDTEFGVFIENVKVENNGFYIAINRYESEINLWLAVTKVIAELPNVQIETGNCEFTGEQWINYIETGVLHY
ncbi:hypothetical protein VQL36_18565 [Chengkuizengella sp. SCS-71B]|uniref:hypothetical protein n=1 Tax=Chengkuizengella sp. SCS-71B TaxID=3115290 RepID=UPI0032C21797